MRWTASTPPLSGGGGHAPPPRRTSIGVWLWARPEAQGVVDVLFVDEAGQMSLTNVLAASQGAASVVLLGDPQQLEQPQQGTHPEGADVSALEHILQNHKTISDERGIFLPETWRLAPSICDFTSEVFYEGKLHPRPGLEKQTLVGTAPFEGAGLFVAIVSHEGNQNSSIEEVDLVEKIVAILLKTEARWVDGDGVTRKMAADGVAIVAPYNSHVSLLTERLGRRGVRIGTLLINFRDNRLQSSSTRWPPRRPRTRPAEWSSCII